MRAVILHNIRSTHNVGAIFRTAEGFGIDMIILTGYTPHPTFDGDNRLPHIATKLTAQIHKTALGAEKMIPFTYYETLDEALMYCNDRQMPLLALEQADNSVSIETYTSPSSWALLLGEEVHGIPPHILDKCETILEIPMQGKKESFNVSVATGVALYALTVNTP